MTFAIVGAGPTGVELAGQIRELAARSLAEDFRHIDPSTVRVILIDGGAQPLANFGGSLSGRARKELEKMGVELCMGQRVVGVDALGVDTEGSDGAKGRFECATTIWAAGVQASPLAGMLAEATGASTDRAGRVAVLPDLTLPGHPEVFAVGDMATVNNLPGVCEVALQGGLHAANTVKRRLAGKEAVAFTYRDLGSAAAIGRFKAIVSVRGLHLSGFPGWVVWLFVHVAFLNGFGNRARALWRWSRSMLGRARPERVFSVGHTGGDLSLPEEVRAKVMPRPFPLLESDLGLIDRVGRREEPARRRARRTAPSKAEADLGSRALVRTDNYVPRMILDRFLVTDQVAVVTASGRGIGAATAVALAEAGADVVLAARTEDQLRDVAEQVEAAGRRAVVVPGTSPTSTLMASLAERAWSEFGRLDIVVNNMGGTMPRPLLDTSPRFLEEAFRFNVAAGHALVRAAVPRMLEGDHAGGAIVNISSVMGHVAGRGYLGYGTVKGALEQYTRLASRDLAPRIRVNAIGGRLDRHLRPRHRHVERRAAYGHGGGHAAQAARSRRGHRRGHPLPVSRRPGRTSPARSSRSTAACSRPTSSCRLPDLYGPYAAASQGVTHAVPRRAVEHRQRGTPRPRRHRCPSRARAGRALRLQPATRSAATPASWPGSGHAWAWPATGDVDALLALRPDCIVHTAMADDRIFEALADLERFLAAGINVVSSSPVFLQYPAPDDPHGRADHRGGADGRRLPVRQRGRPRLRQRRAAPGAERGSASASRRSAAPRCSTTTPTTNPWSSSTSWASAAPSTTSPCCSSRACSPWPGAAWCARSPPASASRSTDVTEWYEREPAPEDFEIDAGTDREGHGGRAPLRGARHGR